jgi:hypothetical protein
MANRGLMGSDPIIQNMVGLYEIGQQKKQAKQQEEERAKNKRIDDISTMLPLLSPEARPTLLNELGQLTGIEFDMENADRVVDVMKRVSRAKTPEIGYQLLNQELPHISRPGWIEEITEKAEKGMKFKMDQQRAQTAAKLIVTIKNMPESTPEEWEAKRQAIERASEGGYAEEMAKISFSRAKKPVPKEPKEPMDEKKATADYFKIKKAIAQGEDVAAHAEQLHYISKFLPPELRMKALDMAGSLPVPETGAPEDAYDTDEMLSLQGMEEETATGKPPLSSFRR